MAMTVSWESLSDTLSSLSARVRDLETARKLFSLKTETIDTTLVFSDTVGDKPLNAWISGLGPDLTGINIYSGSLLVVVSANIKAIGVTDASEVHYSWSLEDTTGTVFSPTAQAALSVRWSPDISSDSAVGASYAKMFTNLTPGEYSVLSKYRCDSTGAAPRSGGSVTDRHILAIPF